MNTHVFRALIKFSAAENQSIALSFWVEIGSKVIVDCEISNIFGRSMEQVIIFSSVAYKISVCRRQFAYPHALNYVFICLGSPCLQKSLGTKAWLH